MTINTTPPSYSTFPCNHRICNICPFTYSLLTIQGPKQSFQVKQYFTCIFSNLAYCIRCIQCGLLYFGEIKPDWVTTLQNTSEKFAKKNIFDNKSIRKWSARSILEPLREVERVDAVTWFPEQTVKAIWQNASPPELSNKHQDIAWRAVRTALPMTSCMYAWLNKELTLTKCCKLAHSKVQDYVLRELG
eukprot:g39790.t1